MIRLLWLIAPFLLLFTSINVEAKLVRKRTPDCYTTSPAKCETSADNPPKSGGTCFEYEFYLKDNGWTKGGYVYHTLCAGGQAPMKFNLMDRPGYCIPPARAGTDAEGRYCEKEEEECVIPKKIVNGKCVDPCEEWKDKTVDFNSAWLTDDMFNNMGGCSSGGCSAKYTALQCSSGLMNGSNATRNCSGTAKYDGGSCNPPPEPPPDTKPKEPQSQNDCPAGSYFGYANGKKVCAKGSTQNKTEYCSKPENQWQPTCAEGGKDYCQVNTKDQACVPGSPRYCALNADRATDPSCQVGTPDFCKSNPTHASCIAGTPEHCAINPTAPACSSNPNNPNACTQDPNSEACKAVQKCTLNPSDPACTKGDNKDQYCAKFPDDPQCKKSNGSPWSKPGGKPGQFKDIKGDIENARAKFTEYHGRIKEEGRSLVGSLTQSNGSLPRVSVDTQFLGEVALDFTVLDDKLGNLGALVIFMATCVAAFTVFKP